MKQIKPRKFSTSRRSFLRAGLAAPGAVGVGLLAGAWPSRAVAGDSPTQGDIDILRFLAAAEILETDLWQQYNELGGIQDAEVPGGSGSKPYIDQLQALTRTTPHNPTAN